MLWAPLTEEDKKRYSVLNKENLEFLMNRYNKVNRWVIADMIRRSAYHNPDKPAVIFQGKTLTYSQLEREPTGWPTPDRTGREEIRSVHSGPQHHSSRDHLVGCAKIAPLPGHQLLLRGKDNSYCIDHSESVALLSRTPVRSGQGCQNDMPTVRPGSGRTGGRQAARKRPVRRFRRLVREVSRDERMPFSTSKIPAR